MATANILSQKERQNRLMKLDMIFPVQPDTSGWEDFQSYFPTTDPEALPETIQRFAAVTGHGDFIYIYADFVNRCDAKKKAMENMLDGIFSETPIAVVDLDLWRFWEPRGSWGRADDYAPYVYSIEWKEAPRG